MRAVALRDRLRTLRPAAPAGAPPLPGRPDPTDAAPPRGHPSGIGDPSGSGSPPESGLEAVAPSIAFGDHIALRTYPTPVGPALGAERVYPLDHGHGEVPIGAALSVPETGWRRLLPLADRPFPVERALFLDLETTGLSRGPGTYAFLIGVGRYVEGGFRLRQFFMRDYDDESVLLEALRLELADAEALVTFNGRSFDWPLLETRATMNRLRLPLLPHLDVLHSARRMWQPIFGGCSLGRLEEAVLGVRRRDDVPGHEIPQRYFDFLETGDAEPLADVIIHNRLDILSMAALVGRVGQAVANPTAGTPDIPELSPEELFTVGRWLLPDAEGVACLELALERGLAGELGRRCSQELATAYRRTGRTDEAAALLENMVRRDGLSTWALIELAKHHEHRTRDLHSAREWTLRALELVRRRRRLRGAGAAARRIGGRLTARIGIRRPAQEPDPERSMRGLDPERPSGIGTAPRSDLEHDAVLHRLQRIERKLRAGSRAGPPGGVAPPL